MTDSPYPELDKLIIEYEKYSGVLQPDGLLMVNYPKMLVMSVASLFEVRIKQRIMDFVTNPTMPLQPNYPSIAALSTSGNKTVADKIYEKFYTADANFSAEKFYDFFGGQAFKTQIQMRFEIIKTDSVQHISEKLQVLNSLVTADSQYEIYYANYSDIKDRWERLSFFDSERSFLSIKFRRNKVAHNYIAGLSDSFIDIRNFYYDSVFYVSALEDYIYTLTVYG